MLFIQFEFPTIKEQYLHKLYFHLENRYWNCLGTLLPDQGGFIVWNSSVVQQPLVQKA
jgi:hypothetical protein